MEYDLIRLFEHPLRFRSCIPSTVVTLGGQENDVQRAVVVAAAASSVEPA
jgi:hypothetical protein